MRLLAYVDDGEAVRPMLTVIVRDDTEAREVARKIRDAPGPSIAFYEVVRDGRALPLTA